jgi:NAD(P)-dependent dehydrogenase (short-subunit alcohol dehydrogenase family)
MRFRKILRSPTSTNHSLNARFPLINDEDIPMSDFRAQIETSLFGTIIVTKAALPHFRRRKAGHFVQFSSMGGPCVRGPRSGSHCVADP